MPALSMISDDESGMHDRGTVLCLLLVCFAVRKGDVLQCDFVACSFGCGVS